MRKPSYAEARQAYETRRVIEGACCGLAVDQLEYVYGDISRADQAPGADALKRFEELDGALKEQIRKLDQVLGAT